jgi:hypothetical protein
VGRDVVCEDDNVEGMQRHEISPGYAVTKCGTALSGRKNQTLTTPADCPFWSYEDSPDCPRLAVRFRGT